MSGHIRGLLALPQGLIEQLGEEKMRQFAGLMHEVAESFRTYQRRSAGKDETGK